MQRFTSLDLPVAYEEDSETLTSIDPQYTSTFAVDDLNKSLAGHLTNSHAHSNTLLSTIANDVSKLHELLSPSLTFGFPVNPSHSWENHDHEQFLYGTYEASFDILPLAGPESTSLQDEHSNLIPYGPLSSSSQLPGSSLLTDIFALDSGFDFPPFLHDTEFMSLHVIDDEKEPVPIQPWLRLSPSDYRPTPPPVQKANQTTSHSDIRSYKKLRHQCPFTLSCNRSFARLNDLHRHIALLHLIGQQGYICDKCGYQFSREESRKRHKELKACGKRVGRKFGIVRSAAKAEEQADALRSGNNPAVCRAWEYLRRRCANQTP